MQRFELPFRQVHLDFHTSEHIARVGADFDPEAFAATLADAHVDSVTCFARCHHGWLYYDSKHFPELVHPGLPERNLLERQIEACHRRGIRVPVYTTVQWDHKVSREHPEWRIVDEKGAPIGTPVYEPGFYGSLCVNSPYRDHLRALTADLLECVPEADGLFFDIVYTDECSCRHCRQKMIGQGLEPSRAEDRKRFADETMRHFLRETATFVRSAKPGGSLFFNRSHVGIFQRDVVDAHSHFELESLPSGTWGYMHFPVTIRYARTLGLDCLGQTGRFHTEWGDFHSYKNPAALEYECFRMLALGAKCMVGDQCEPSGVLSRTTYGLIGPVYAQVAEREAWCAGAVPRTDIGVLNPEEWGDTMLPSIVGATRMLEECGHQFDIIDSRGDFDRYKVLVLPDDIRVDAALADRLERYAGNGGAILASFESGLSAAGTEFVLPCLGVRMKAEQTRDLQGRLVRGRSDERNDYADFLLPTGALASGLDETEHVMYMKGVEVEALPGAEVLAPAIAPFFHRTYRHFSSHLQAPSSGRAAYDGVVRRGRCVYFAHPVFGIYDRKAPRWCRTMVRNALALLLPEPLVKHDGPGTMLATLNDQPRDRRLVLHLLHYVPVRRSRELDILEDVLPVYGVHASVRVPESVTRVRLVPEGTDLPFEEKDGRIVFEVPEVRGYRLVELAYGE